MESECPTPYNSLYIPVKRKDVVCCKHGIACEVARKEKEQEMIGEDNISDQYVNLVDTKRDATKTRDELIQSLAGRLKELEARNVRRKEKKRSRRRRAKEERIKEEERCREMERARLKSTDENIKMKGDESEQGSRQKAEEFVRKQDESGDMQGDDDLVRRLEGDQSLDDAEHQKRREKRRKSEGLRGRKGSFDYDDSSKKVRKRGESKPTKDQSSSPSSDRGFPVKKHPTFRKPGSPRGSYTSERSKGSQRKSRRKESSSDFSSSVSRGLVGDLDVSEGTRSRRKKEHREKKKRERRQPSETSGSEQQMFESIRNIMPREEETGQQGRVDMETSQPPPVSAGTASQQPLKGIAKSVYIGVCNFAKAEEQVEKRSDFRVYHQLAHRPLLDDLEQELPLIVVYKTANGSFRHYPIRRRKVGNSSYFYVDYGDPKVQAHASLDHLVRYYQINAQRHPNNRQYADQFPWWEVHL
ncbi:unnamed protein product [Cylicocyclus nassatus]|uniref:Uncharacterized protein n=1 Tax=Cylicocyclus nassatus TaxID=53992 RepID=A0AA36H3M0_CYLNA|nr:unnamed protein product [Cylicocyclus nassatus]